MAKQEKVKGVIVMVRGPPGIAPGKEGSECV